MKLKFYKVIDHTADLGIEINASTQQELFQQAALAFCDLICDFQTIQAKAVRTIKIQKRNIEELLQAFLSELLYNFEVEHELYSKIKIEDFSNNGLSAIVYGEKLDLERHEIKTGIKAVTFHQLKIEKIENKWHARIIFDV